MIVAIHQPSYFPWLGLLHKIAGCETFVLMDEVQLADRAYQHRNLFLDAAGQPQYLSIPFVRKDYRQLPLRALQIADAGWTGRHWNFLRSNYGRHPFAAEILPRLEGYYAAPHATLFEAVLASMRLALDLFDLRPRVLLQSSLDYDRSLHKGDLILALLRATGASAYLSGTGAQAYLDEAAFGPGLALRYDRFSHPAYPQKHAAAFQPGLACLDVLFNLGLDASRALLRGAGAQPS